MSTTPKDPRLFELFTGAIQTGLRYVSLAETGKTHIGKHTPWPEITWHDNGLPWVSSKGSEGPNKYSDAILSVYASLYGITPEPGGPPLRFETEPEFVALVEYVKNHPHLHDFLFPDGPSDLDVIRLEGIVGDILDRYINLNKTVKLDRTKLLPIYLPIENYLFEDTLPSVVVVPILFLKFEVETFQINEFVSVGTLSNELHLARGWHGPWSDNDNELVESAATHALFITGRSIKKHNSLFLRQPVMELESYPIQMIDTFFAAVRIVTGFATGYAQLLTLPVGWASGYTADLIPLEGPTLKKYPPFFERGAWRDEVPTVSSSDLDTIGYVFKNLCSIFETSHGRRVRLAMHRLNLSAMRTTDEDGVIDAMIAMEALLSDDRQEMTHKVAMRLAGLYKIVDRSRSEQAFRELKRIYSFRSKIVHGDADLDKHREIDRDGARVPAVNAAVEHLRTAFGALIKNPTLLDPKKIDSFLLTDKPPE